ncbi:MAG: polyphenol oxidase family protein [Coriobacteriia bacterium]|nr:polyphenol oxidase family protein [Coriobacteriia bacterium]
MAALVRTANAGVSLLTDAVLRETTGIVVAFTERTGGRSTGPFASLNLASHVGDDHTSVDENRARLLESLGMERLRDRLTVPEQVHGLTVRAVTGATAGMGAFARTDAPPPVPATDALYTLEPETPLMMCFADCVPVILVATTPVRAVSVVHAGWRGALGRLPGAAAVRLSNAAGCEPADLIAYIGPHIGACHYEVGETLLSQFANAFGSIAVAQGRLDLSAVVSKSLDEVGVPHSSVVHAGVCTAERTDAFYSYRTEGLTGRHGAIACILGAGR